MKHEITSKMVVDLDADPMVSDGWAVEEHIKGGQLEFDSVKVALYLDEDQQQGTGSINGHELRQKLKGEPVYNANLLEFYLANPNLIPEEWKGWRVFFWGTIYHLSHYCDLFVRYMYWSNDRWDWHYGRLGYDFDNVDLAVISAKK